MICLGWVPMAQSWRGGCGGKGAHAVYLFLFLDNIVHLSIVIDYRPGESPVAVTRLPRLPDVALCRLRGSVGTFPGQPGAAAGPPCSGLPEADLLLIPMHVQNRIARGGCLAGRGWLALDYLRNV